MEMGISAPSGGAGGSAAEAATGAAGGTGERGAALPHGHRGMLHSPEQRSTRNRGRGALQRDSAGGAGTDSPLCRIVIRDKRVSGNRKPL